MYKDAKLSETVGDGGASTGASRGGAVADQLRSALIDQAQRVVALFNSWDKDGDGTITKAEFRRALPELGMWADPKDIDELFDSFDSDGGGSISFRELNGAHGTWMIEKAPRSPASCLRWQTSAPFALRLLSKCAPPRCARSSMKRQRTCRSVNSLQRSTSTLNRASAERRESAERADARYATWRRYGDPRRKRRGNTQVTEKSLKTLAFASRGGLSRSHSDARSRDSKLNSSTTAAEVSLVVFCPHTLCETSPKPSSSKACNSVG